MVQTGFNKLLRDLAKATAQIDFGRKALHTEGYAEIGRVAFAAGIANALATFKAIQAILAPQAIIPAEKIYLQQDIEFCDPEDKFTIKSLMRSLNYLSDALRAIEIVKLPVAYQNAEATHTTEKRDKRGGVPKDVMHTACKINSDRLDRNNRTPGLTMIEKELIKQRKANLATGLISYISMQQEALGLPKIYRGKA
jgi:hypothetical protein